MRIELKNIKTVLPLIALVVGAFLTTNVSAQILSHSQVDIDGSIIQPDDSYSIPTGILVVPIFAPSSEFQVRDLDWFRGLFYFLVANDNHSGFTDIPFHYVVSRDGRIFKGNSGGEERKIRIDGEGDNKVVIGYLAGNSDTSFDPRAEAVLGELLMSVAGRNQIKLNAIKAISVEYIRDDETQTVSLQKEDLFGIWGSALEEVISKSRYLYQPRKKQYEIEIVEVRLPIAKVNPGERVSGSLVIKNLGEFGIYKDTISEILATKTTKGASKFYDTKSWLSGSQFGLLDDGASIRPGEQAVVSFILHVPLYFGIQKENYRVTNIQGDRLPGTEFEVKLDVKKPKGIIVEVRPTQTGWLRVRSQPSGAATEIGRISTGERYFQTKNAGNGWVQLDLGGGKRGWVSIQYLKYL